MTLDKTLTIVRSLLAGMAWALTVAAWPLNAEEEGSITVASWGGPPRAFYERFIKESGIELKVDDYNGGLAQVRVQVETGNVAWDVVQMEAGDTLLGCDEGLLETVDYETLPAAPDGTPATEDFVADYEMDCGVKYLLYSTVIAYNDTTIPGRKPATMADFFDLENFPGRRGMRRTPNTNLEFALVADGVPADRVYTVLSTQEGIARAFRKLDTVKSQVVWWEVGAQPAQLLADGEVMMSTAFNGRIFKARASDNQPFSIVWDGQVLASGYLVIVAGSPRLEMARQFVAFATNTESLAKMTRFISYTPQRSSSLALVNKHLETGIDIKPHLPNAPQNMTNAVREDAEWWADNQDEMNERFAAWLNR